MTYLTKADIKGGKSITKEFTIEGLDKPVLLRTLTDYEYSEITAIKKNIGKAKVKVPFDKKGNPDTDKAVEEAEEKLKNGLDLDIDLQKIEEVNFKADCLTVAYGLSVDEQWRESDVRQLRPIGIVKKIAEKVIEISKLDSPETLEKDVEDFRK